MKKVLRVVSLLLVFVIAGGSVFAAGEVPADAMGCLRAFNDASTKTPVKLVRPVSGLDMMSYALALSLMEKSTSKGEVYNWGTRISFIEDSKAFKDSVKNVASMLKVKETEIVTKGANPVQKFTDAHMRRLAAQQAVYNNPILSEDYEFAKEYAGLYQIMHLILSKHFDDDKDFGNNGNKFAHKGREILVNKTDRKALQVFFNTLSTYVPEMEKASKSYLTIAEIDKIPGAVVLDKTFSSYGKLSKDELQTYKFLFTNMCIAHNGIMRALGISK